ncbi:MAG: hypothetical protein ACRCTW_08540, partial [Lactococcus garvieae]
KGLYHTPKTSARKYCSFFTHPLPPFFLVEDIITKVPLSCTYFFLLMPNGGYLWENKVQSAKKLEIIPTFLLFIREVLFLLVLV